jgi:hypothetical protein
MYEVILGLKSRETPVTVSFKEWLIIPSVVAFIAQVLKFNRKIHFLYGRNMLILFMFLYQVLAPPCAHGVLPVDLI